MMGGLFEIREGDINRLCAWDLTMLLKRLLVLDAEASGIRHSAVTASLSITVSDGGEDASIEWQGPPESTPWIPNRNTLFQCKATSIGPTACGREVVTADGSAVKPRIDQVLSAGGAYVLFSTTPCNKKMKEARIAKMREAFQSLAKPYAQTAQIFVYGAGEISNWANTYISAITAVKIAIGVRLPAFIKTWEEWNRYPEYSRSFICDNDLIGKIDSLRSLFTSGARRVARIIGLSGVGKTRLALEAFKPAEDPRAEPERQALSEGCVYIDAESSQDLLECVAEWVRDHYSGVLVIDNCEMALHKALIREVGHTDSRLNLLTLDYSMDDHPRDHPYIEMTGVSDEVVKGMIQGAYPGLSDSDVGRVVSFAQGFPRMAVLIADAQLEQEPDIANLRDKDLIDRLLWQRTRPDPDARKVIEACSLFRHLGYDNDVVAQRIFAAERICRMDRNDFYRHVEYFIRRRVIDRRGRYIRVVPFPLAITLAAKWWQGCSPELAQELFLTDMPDGVTEALYDQLANLNFVPRAKEIIAVLCGQDGPFGQAEVLLSEQGSRLFRSIVEVDPEPCLSALNNAIGGMTREQLLGVGPARRNFVWALEKLCFWRGTFQRAARLMLKLASAENESWGNNATYQFLQLFHLHLSGTQAEPDARIEIVDEALASECPETRALGLRAMESALETQYFSRMGGVEQQGSRAPSHDWAPANWDDVLNYQDKCIERLTRVICGSDRDLARLAARGLGNSLRGLIQRSRQASLDTAVRSIALAQAGFWPEALHSLRKVLKYEGSQMPAEVRGQVESWVALLQPQGLEERINLLVSLPDYEYREVEGSEHYVDIAEERANALAFELGPQIQQLFPYLSMLLQGEQRKAYTFGLTLAKVVPDKETFALSSLAALGEVERGNGNPSMLCGFLAGVSQREITEGILELASRHEALVHYLVELTRLSKPTMEDLERVIASVREGRIPIHQLQSFSVNSVLDHLMPPSVMYFCDEIASLGISGVAHAFGILFMYCLGERERYAECRPAFRRYISTPGLLGEVCGSPTLHGDRWEQIALSLIKHPQIDVDLAESISRDIVAVCAQKHFPHSMRYYMPKVLVVLLHEYFESAWPQFGEALLRNEWPINFHLANLLSADHDKMKSGNTLASAPLDGLLKWGRGTQPNGPRSIARCLPVFRQGQEDQTIGWHPYAIAFIDAFGDDEGFLHEMDANLGTFSWSGSIIPYYEMQIELMQELCSHGIARVRRWAEEKTTWLNEKIAQERMREEEYGIGIN
jgi:hypothetical protein